MFTYPHINGDICAIEDTRQAAVVCAAESHAAKSIRRLCQRTYMEFCKSSLGVEKVKTGKIERPFLGSLLSSSWSRLDHCHRRYCVVNASMETTISHV